MSPSLAGSQSERPLPARLPTWNIYLARGQAKLLGIVEAADADAAIEQAVKEFDVKDRWRLIAVRRP